MGFLRLVIGLVAMVGALALSTVSEAVDLWRFPLAWWGVLVALDGAVRLRHGRSPISSGRQLLLLAASSVLFWDLFELVNLRLRNWWYVGVPRSFLGGAAFSAVSFATVLPAVRLGFALASPRVESGTGPSKAAESDAVPLCALGSAALLLSLAAPRHAFPLAWLFLWPLCEAWLVRGEGREGALRSPLQAFRTGDRAHLLRLLACALPLGFLWEGLNFRCERGWVYTVPFFEEHKLFEMPLPGYLGYLPFLLEAGATLALLDRFAPLLRSRRGAAALCALALLHLGAEGLARGRTAISVSPLLADAASIAPPVRDDLLRAGLRTPRDVLRAERRFAVPEDVRRLGELAGTAGMGTAWAERLLALGVRDASALAQEDWRALFEKLSAQGDPPPPALVRLWIRAARRGDPR